VVDAADRQIPYIVEQALEPLSLDVALEKQTKLPEALGPPKAGRTVYRVTYPMAGLPESRLVLSTTARVFDRRVSIVEEREPDHWESHDILLAIGALAAGMYALSTSYAIRALSPTGRRITLARVHTTPPPAGGELMTALKHVCLMHCRHSDIGTYNRVSCQPSSLALLASST